jgi:hypothetical protein
MLMTEPIWQFRLLAQGGDAEGWMNILFIVVVAVIWAIGGIVKAAGANRKNRQQQEKRLPEQDPPKQETLLGKLAKKAEEFQRAVELQAKQATERPRQPEGPGQKPRPAAGRVAVRTGRAGQSVLVYERQPPSAAVQRKSEVQSRTSAPRPDRRRERSTTAGSAPTRPKTSVVAQKATPARVSALLADYSDADALKRAVLHSEILGKPLALRDPLEQSRHF